MLHRARLRSGLSPILNHSSLQEMVGAYLARCELNALRRACELFEELLQSGGSPSQSQCAALIEQCCARGLGVQASDALGAMAAAGLRMAPRVCCLTIGALVRSGKPLAAFGVFEEHLEGTNGVDASVDDFLTTGYNVEHSLALLTKVPSRDWTSSP